MTAVPEPGAPAASEPADPEPALSESASLESASLEPASLEPASPEPAVSESASSESASSESAGPTGHPVVDAALGELDAAAELDPAQQVAAYEQAHRALSQTLAAIDQS
jgi:hypothetical protein